MTTATACRHHWVIEQPRGFYSRGRCRNCGEVREFRNGDREELVADKTCTGCGRTMPATPRFFAYKGALRLGLCRACHGARRQAQKKRQRERERGGRISDDGR